MVFIIGAVTVVTIFFKICETSDNEISESSTDMANMQKERDSVSNAWESSGEEGTDQTETQQPSVADMEGIDKSAEVQAQEILSGMSLEEKVGQMFLARCPEDNTAQKAAEYHLGGYILFARDFREKTGDQIIRDIQSYACRAL